LVDGALGDVLHLKTDTTAAGRDRMTRAELDVLQSRDLLGEVRLSCQAVCDHDMKVRPLMTVTSTGLDGPGPKPEPEITPPPEWIEKPA